MTVDVITPPRTMLEIYESLPEGTPVQLIQNKLIMSPSPFTNHQQVLGKLYIDLKNFIDKHQFGEVLIAPYDVHLGRKNIFQPDLLVIGKEDLHKIRENGFYGAPDLVIEILSPSTAKYDKTEKKEVYEKYGVKEYWLVDPKTGGTEGFLLQNGKYESLGKGKQNIQLRIMDLQLKF